MPEAVVLDAVSIRREGQVLLDGVSHRFEARGITVLMGPNGAGKSLTLRVLAGLVAPDAGQVGPKAPGLPGMALVFQRPVLLRRSVAGNLAHALSVLGVSGARRSERVQALLDLGGLSELAGRPARRLSGGEQQRLALVRALAGRPGMLLLDEPTASLDPQATEAIEALIRQTADAGTGVVLVTHDRDQARRLADEVVFLNRGRVVEAGPAAAFFADPRSAEARAYLDGGLLI